MAKKNKSKLTKREKRSQYTETDTEKWIGYRQPRGNGPLRFAAAAFTLADEARQTSEQDHSAWTYESKLRAKPVKFASAGVSQPLDLLETDDRHGSEEVERQTDKGVQSDVQSDVQSEASHVFFYDTKKKTEQLGDAIDQKPVYASEGEQTDDTNSSEEVILFKGRYRAKTPDQGSSNIATCRDEKPTRVEPQYHTEVLESSIGEQQSQKHSKQHRRRRSSQQAKRQGIVPSDDEDSMLADYIANMRENGELEDILGQAADAQLSSQEAHDSTSEAGEAHAAMPGDSDTGTSNWAGMEYRKGDGDSDSIQSRGQPMRLSTSPPAAPFTTPGDITGVMDYADFDPMDWERPSLRQRKKKGNKVKLNLQFAMLDLETEQRLQAAWKSDRLKKAERKRERESMRAAGLLGKNANPDDARIKYPAGMSAQQVTDELRGFVAGSDNSFCYPPMGKHVRKLIHELANKFNIKSKSIGKGDQRRPILYRTSRTVPYDDAMFDQVVGRLNRRYFPRLDSKGKGTARPSAGRNGYATAASYREGEVVGAAAPELGSRNRGRAMLEKMGWSSGTALGALENKGILLPVTQTMKRSKAGLG